MIATFNAPQPVLVTGGTGFIGRRLVAALLARGAQVRVLVRDQAQCSRPHAGEEIENISGDLTDSASLTQACAGMKTIFHIAGFAHADAGDTPEFATRHWVVNAQGTFDLLDAAREAGVRRFVFLSSVKAVGDPGSRCVDEGWDASPETPYGQAKRAAEEQVLAVGRESGMHTVNLRPALVYGPGMQANLLRLIEAVRRGWLPPLPETGNRRSLVHVDDVAQALLLAANHPGAAGRTYFVTDGRAYSGRELYQLIRQALGRPVPNWAVPAKALWGLAELVDSVRWIVGYRDRKAQAMLDKLLGWACYNSHRITDELGYQPVWDLERALRNELKIYPQ
ncbi:MAG: NAD-dependent epimerase/dehydratase family protein [Candidatus Competibacteraceae bacterium]|nr:NAD-dependent epimerase/dehydratase family protein [Candidatus Competibacteraceae bacterium]HRY14349.1 NAD-dependent epimerase/dehydratase family protein [Candidatus Competibacteraceae bacterium]